VEKVTVLNIASMIIEYIEKNAKSNRARIRGKG